MMNTLVRKSSLANQVEQILIDQINAGVYLAGEKLPSDEKLASEFNVSRATIRAALNAMSANRLIVPKHGVGTFVSQAAQLKNPLDQSIDFLDLISSSGFKADFKELFSRIIKPDQNVQEKLKLESGHNVLEVHKVFSADGEPVIYSQNYIPEWVFCNGMSAEQAITPGSTEPFFDFFRDTCQCELQFYLSDVWVGMPSDYPVIIEVMQAEECTPVLVIDEVGYDKQNRPVNYAIEYLPGNRMHFSLVRKCKGR